MKMLLHVNTPIRAISRSKIQKLPQKCTAPGRSDVEATAGARVMRWSEKDERGFLGSSTAGAAGQAKSLEDGGQPKMRQKSVKAPVTNMPLLWIIRREQEERIIGQVDLFLAEGAV